MARHPESKSRDCLPRLILPGTVSVELKAVCQGEEEQISSLIVPLPDVVEIQKMIKRPCDVSPERTQKGSARCASRHCRAWAPFLPPRGSSFARPLPRPNPPAAPSFAPRNPTSRSHTGLQATSAIKNEVESSEGGRWTPRLTLLVVVRLSSAANGASAHPELASVIRPGLVHRPWFCWLVVSATPW